MKTIQLTDDEAKLLQDALTTAMQSTWEMKEKAFQNRMDMVGKELFKHYNRLSDLDAKVATAETDYKARFIALLREMKADHNDGLIPIMLHEALTEEKIML